MMQRVVEPELMDDEAQALAYSQADFEEAHEGVLAWYQTLLPDGPTTGLLLDLGCGPGDVLVRFLKAFDEIEAVGVDGSRPMLELALKRMATERCSGRARFIEGTLPTSALPQERPYSLILSTSLLHHLHDPLVLWRAVREYGAEETVVFVTDLTRPGSVEEARELVSRYAPGAPDVLARDFFNSLSAAFTPEEVRMQLQEAGLSELEVVKTSDRHMAIFGRLGEQATT